ncbi:hypothetical protein ABZ341_34700, partial [Streptomyces sp. NPDC006173]
QARLHSRFGRAWRRKAPVESLMPLRLARYGVPLAQTAPSGLAAAGIEPVLLPPPPQLEVAEADLQTPPAPTVLEHAELKVEANQPGAGNGRHTLELTEAQAKAGKTAQRPAPAFQDASDGGLFADAYQSWLAQSVVKPTPGQFALFLRDQFAITTAAGNPLSNEQLSPIVTSMRQRYESTSIAHDAENGGKASEDVAWEEFFYRAWLDYAHEYGSYPEAAVLARYVFERDGITTTAGVPLIAEDLHAFVQAFQQRGFARRALPVSPPPTCTDETKNAPESPSDETQQPDTRADAVNDVPGPKPSRVISDQNTPVRGDHVLTVVDRYYLAWNQYQDEHGQEPSDKQLSKSLASSGVTGRNGEPVSPSTLRRYFLHFRIYQVWADHRARMQEPSPVSVARDCVHQGITAQYRKPITHEDIAKHADDFERRWQTMRPT